MQNQPIGGPAGAFSQGNTRQTKATPRPTSYYHSKNFLNSQVVGLAKYEIWCTKDSVGSWFRRTTTRRVLRGFFIENNPHQEKDNQEKEGSNQNIGVNSPKITHFSNISSYRIVNNKKTIPLPTFKVKTKTSSSLLGVDKVGPIKAAPKKAADRFTNNPDRALNCGLVNSLFIGLYDSKITY